MKKITRKQRERDKKLGLIKRQCKKRCKIPQIQDNSWRKINAWIDAKSRELLNTQVIDNCKIRILLPEIMNFSNEYEKTTIYITAIRKLSKIRELLNSKKVKISKRAYKLINVDFNALKKISTSAALVLTAELSKWDDTTRQQLIPIVDGWDKTILKQFTDLGFFELFNHTPQSQNNTDDQGTPTFMLVKYIKGRSGDNDKPRVLKDRIVEIVGDKVNKWSFLHGGLTEAIINVSQHAYPDTIGYPTNEKNWYLTGSYNQQSNELKIAFYDQGIGIPNSLPASKVWERVLDFLSRFPLAERKGDEILLKAAVEIDRTRTYESDRGKGLPDLLEFIRQRKGGYLSILSSRGLYKFSINGDKEHIKTEHFVNPIPGTLIIWSAKLLD